MQKLIEKSHPQIGLVISSFGKSVAVEAENGDIFQCLLRRNQEIPVVGDIVDWQLDQETGQILTIHQRRSLLIRGDNHGKKKMVAANIDTIFIIMAPSPIFSEYLVDRYLVAAELLGIKPVIVLNKTDLLDGTGQKTCIERLIPYRQIPYPVVFSSVITANGLDNLAAHLKGKKAVLVGPSGVGKSSIIAAFCENQPRIGAVSPKGAGKHTTTATELYHLPSGGYLIDSPGVREFNLWEISKQEILQGFKDLQRFVGECKFRDCQHLAEPQCVVKEAVTMGNISKQRYENYQTMMKNKS